MHDLLIKFSSNNQKLQELHNELENYHKKTEIEASKFNG